MLANIPPAMLRRFHLLLGLLAAFGCGLASAQSVLDRARLKVYFFDVAFSNIEKTCVDKHPELQASLASVRQKFHRNLLPEIELGREFGRQFVASRGMDIQKEAEQLALQVFSSHLIANSNRSSQQLCEDSIREITDRATWSFDDFLREDFELLMMDVGNRQGLPCDFIPLRLEGLARRFVDGRRRSEDAQQYSDQLLYLEVRDLGDKVSNCISIQARAIEYRVVPGNELQAIREVLDSLLGALMPAWERRIEKGEAERIATLRVKEFLLQRGTK